MKKFIFLLFVCVLLWACSPNSQSELTPGTPTEPISGPLQPALTPGLGDSSTTPADTVLLSQSQVAGTATDLLNIRAGPGLNYAILGQLKQGEAITIVGKSQDGLWWQVSRGWVSATYVQVTGDTAAVPVTTPAAAPTP